MTNHSTTNVSAKIIPFRQKELLLVDNGGQPFVPMKPVVEGMGLDWGTQFRKLQSGRFEATIVEMTIVAADGKSRDMTCLPLRKLAGWLMSIHPGKIKDEDRKKVVIAYQNECDDALWAYWNDGIAVRGGDQKGLDLIGAVIGTSGVNVLDRVIDQKAGVIPKSLQRSFKHTMKSRLRSRFNVQRTDLIPADELANACNFIAAYSLDGEWIGKDHGIQIDAAPGQRFLVSYDHNGEQRVTPVHRDACVMTHQQLIKAMLIPGDLPVSTDEMFEFAQAALANLRMRSDCQAQQLRAGRAAA